MNLVSITSLSRLSTDETEARPSGLRSNIGKTAFHFAINGREYIHAPATGSYVRLDGEMLKRLESLDGQRHLDKHSTHRAHGEYTRLLKILVAAGVLDAGDRQTDVMPQAVPEIIPSFAVLPATSCQLKCVYCYSSSCAPGHGIFVNKNVFDRYIEECLATFFPVAAKANLLLHGGGEPTLDGELFKYLVTEFENKCRNLWMEPGFLMTSNGMFTDEMCDFIIDHNIQCQISLDGPEDIHNAQRPARNGKPAYQRVERNIKRLVAGGITVSIRPTVTSVSASFWCCSSSAARP